MILRRVTRTILNSTETTDKTQTVASSTLAFALEDTDFFYVGFREKFQARYFVMGSTVNAVDAVLTVKYWDGTQYTAVEDLIDQTSVGGKTFAQSGFISFKGQSNWQKKAQTGVDDEELYWLELSVDATLTMGTLLQAVINLFVDNEILRAYYPELISDTRYLPASATNFLEQYVAATNLVAHKLEQKKIIKDISQIIEPNEVAVAATHAAAYIILNGIPNKDEETRKATQDAYDNFVDELSNVNFDLDFDNSGAINDDLERNLGPIYIPR
jgi:hypothetical protein